MAVNDDSRYDYDSQYDHMNAGAHRRPAQQVAAPALTWHRGYWRPTDEKTDELLVRPFDWESLSSWHHQIDLALAGIFDRFYKLAIQDITSKRHHNSRIPAYFSCSNLEDDNLYLFSHKWNFSETSDFKNSLTPLRDKDRSIRHDMFFLRTRLDGVNLVINARRHLEYFCITFTAEYSDLIDDPPENTIEQTAISRHFKFLHDIAMSRYTTSGGKTRPALTGDEELSAYSSDRLMVEPFKDWIVKHCLDAMKGSPIRGTVSLDACGSLFADFFGAIFALRLKDGKSLEFNGPGEIPAGQEETLHHQVTGMPFIDEFAPNVADSIWPVASGLRKYHESEERSGKPEFTVSLFQNRRTMYISSLGRILPARSPSMPRHEPVIYTLIVSYGSKWRLGRMVDWLHTMGELRLAALRDMRAITVSSNLINRAFAILGGIPLEQSHLPSMSEVYSLLDLSGKTIDIGLSMRLERSRYYAANFKDLIGIVNPKPVEGFQSYTQFVHTRVFDAFEFIDRVGRRFEALRRAISIRIEITHRVTIETLQGITADQVSTTATHTRATTHLLRTAEILSVIPISYYSGSMLIHSHRELSREFPFLSWLPAEDWKYYVAGLVPGLCVALLPAILRRGITPTWKLIESRLLKIADRLFARRSSGNQERR